MSESQSIQRLLAQAKEKRFNWLGAAELHKKALDRVHKQKDFLKAGDFQERVGYCFHRAAFQAEDKEEFRERMGRAIEAYEKAHDFYEKLMDEQKAARMLRSGAMIAYMGYWLALKAPQKKKVVEECWRLTKEALKAFEKAGDVCEYERTYNQLSTCIDLGFFFEWDFKARERMIGEAVEYGERAIKFLSTVGDSVELARAYVKTANFLEVFGYYFVDVSEREKYYQKAKCYLQKAREISEEAAMLEVATVLFGNGPGGYWGEGTDSALSNLAKTLEYGRKTRDKFIIGCTLDLLAHHTVWSARTYDDRDERLEHYKKVLQYVEEARRQFCPISFICPRSAGWWVEEPYTGYFQTLAREETDLSERRGFLEKALRFAPEGLKRAESSGYPEVIWTEHRRDGLVLMGLAQIATNSEEKRGLLEKALVHMDETCRISEEAEPLSSWNVNLMRYDRAVTKSDLADLAKDHETRRAMLQEAVTDMETSLKFLIEFAIDAEKEGTVATFSHIGSGQSSLGDLWIRLHEVSQNNEHLQRAIEAFVDAAESCEKLTLKSRVAECHWKIAQICEKLGEHLKAAENFELASNNYKSAADKIPQLGDFYMDHALYMQAWSEIELAKHHHVGKRYDKAKLHYEKSASLHKSTEHWTYLSSNYDAWARLEEAEDLSRKEQTEEARDLFQQASNLFVEAKNPIQAKLEKTEIKEEKELLVNLDKASDTRREYCLGRAALEEAKIFDRKGDHAASSMKYGSAVERFQKVIDDIEDESDRQELEPILHLSQAWQKMTQAEAEVSPDLFKEASQRFEEAKDHSLDEISRILALGHSSFCKALEAGTRFEATRDTMLYSTTKKHLEAATNYYLKAGFKTASEYTKATYRLFDAYMYTNKAQTETDPRKKAQYYHMAEKLLKASAGSYMKAKHPEKSEAIQRLLERVKEERQLVMSLTEVLHAPTITSTTSSFSTPTPTHEKAVGLEKFEHAVIEGHLTAFQEVTVGKEVEVRLDLVNIAKEPGLLVRVDNLVPPNLKVTVSPSQYNIENGSIDMKGKRLEPLKVETVKLSLQATEAGVINLNPKVVYVGEVGKFRTCKPEPVTVTVHPKLALEFKTKAAQNVFKYLVSSFVEDYMRRRLTVQEAGWRSFVQVIKNAKVSSRSVYGSRGSHGSAISELERRGLIETRIFLGERGRGGKIVKARISYEKETVKRLVDQKVVKKE